VSVNSQNIVGDYLGHYLHATGHFDASEFFQNSIEKLKAPPQHERIVRSIFCRRIMRLQVRVNDGHQVSDYIRPS